jgi:6-phosphogluconolactonase
MFRTICYSACVSLLSLALAACGGGSQNSQTSNTNPTPPASSPSPGGGGASGSQPGSAGGGSGAPTSAHFAYVYNTAGSTITGFTVNQSTGGLTPMTGSPFAATSHGDGLAAVGGYLYAAGGSPGSTGVSSYAIGSDGRLTPASRIATSGSISYNLYAHSTGKYLYAATFQGDILGFQITAPGQLTALSGLPQSVGPDVSMTLSPDGRWAFVSHQQTSNGGAAVETYAIDASTGKWSLVVYNGSPAKVGDSPSQLGRQPQQVHLTVDPSNQYLFAANQYQNMVFAFRIGSDGSLTPAGSATSPASSPFSLAATARYAYFGDFAEAKLYGYAFTSGTLALTPGSPYANVMTPAYTMTLDPGGRLLYVVNNDPGSISVWNIAGDGSLSQISGSPFTTPEMHGNQPAYLVLQ